MVRGYQNGRKLCFPTANVDTQAAVPDGVYAGSVRFSCFSESFKAIICVGTSETYRHSLKTFEVHALHDFKGEEFYGCVACVELSEKMRDNQRFERVEDLKQQLGRDRDRALQVL